MSFQNKFYKALKHHGLKDGENPVDYYYRNRESFHKDGNNIEINISDLSRMRWESSIGKACQACIRKFLEKESADSGGRLYGRELKVIDFEKLEFEHEGKTYFARNIQEFLPYGSLYEDKKIINFSYIDLSGIELRCLKFSNTYFFNANFEGANFKKVEFDNCDLPNCNFRNSFLNDVSFKETRFCGSDISGASVAFTHFDDYAVEDKLIYKPISYSYILMYLMAIVLYKIGISVKESWLPNNHTKFFGGRGAKDLTLATNKEFRSYLNWYDYTLTTLQTLDKISLLEKITRVSQLVFTKGWTSLSVLFLWALIINIIFSFIYINLSSQLRGFNGEWLTSFYYSIVTFTTLGYGEIHPIGNLAKIVVIIEVFLGYVILGCFVFILGSKASDRY